MIRGVVTHEKKAHQHLRNITSKQSKRLVAHKLADLTGDKTLEGVQDFVEKVPPPCVLTVIVLAIGMPLSQVCGRSAYATQTCLSASATALVMSRFGM